MTYGSTHPVKAHHTDAGAHVLIWTISLLGLLAAAVGAYIAIAPADGTITILKQTWEVSEISDTWAQMLLIIGGAITAIGMVISIDLDRRHENTSTALVVGEGILALVGVAAIIAAFIVV